MHDEPAAPTAQPAILQAALAYSAAGCSVVPARTDGTKAPAAFWKTHQNARADPGQIHAWFTTGGYDGLGVITGQISAPGGHYLELLELEGRAVHEGLIEAYHQALADHDLADLWSRITAGHLETTPSGGLHILYRVQADEPRGSTKLARRPSTADELAAWKAEQQADIDAEQDEDLKTKRQAALDKVIEGRQVPQVLIETRGEGGFTVTAPSAGRTHPSGKAWTLLTGGPASIADISEEERDALHAIASLLDAMPAPPPLAAPNPAGRGSAGLSQPGADGRRPGDDFNERGDWQDILAGHFTRVGHSGNGYTWRRVGKKLGVSATTGTRGDGDNLYVFSSSTLFEQDTPYSKFAAWTLLEHGGDYGAAARELAAQGYGDPLPRGDEGLHELIADYEPAKHGPFNADNPRPGTTYGVDGNLATVHELRPMTRTVTSYGHELHRGQLRFANRFTQRWGDQYLHVHGIGWHFYDGARWAECLDGAEHRAVLTLAEEAFAEMPALNSDARKDLFKDVGKLESANGVRGVLDLAANMHPCTLAGNALDADPRLLNTRAGTVHLDAGQVTPPAPSDHLSKVTRARFDPGTTAPLFEEFLDRIQPDADMRAFLARQLGSALLGVIREHVLFIWHGSGSNGKGTLRDAILHALGDYAVEVPAELLLVTRNANLAPERMRLKGARVAFCSEIAAGAKLDEPTMKKLTGGDPVNAKMLYRNPIQFDPSHTLFMLTNHLPQVRGDDPATWRRILAIPFNTVIPAGERDGELPEKLKESPDAILAWLWAGWLDYREQGLNPPTSVLDATRKYQLDSDVLARFLADEDAVVLGHGSVGSALLYRAFIDWCKAQGEVTEMTNRAFTEAMTARSHRKKKTNAGIIWEHIMIVDKNAGEARW